MIATQITLARRWFGRRPATARRHRVYAIGDVHARLDLFTELIQRLEADNAQRDDGKSITLIVLGDFIDRGPSSRRLVQLLMSVQQRSRRLTVLLGNHEAVLLDCINGDADAQRLWLRAGGLATLESYGIDPPASGEHPDAFADRLGRGLTPAVVDWLSGLPLSIRCGSYFFCHAGVRPGTSLHRQARGDLLWIRQPFLSSRRDFGAVVVHGHSVFDTARFDRNRISLDTGAYRSGILSAVCLDGPDAWLFATEPPPAPPAAYAPIDRTGSEAGDLAGQPIRHDRLDPALLAVLGMD